MLMNNLDPEVAEDPANLVVYGGTGRAARSWEAFHAHRRDAAPARDDETLLVQSGKPVGVFRTHEMAPRVLIANSLLVPDWADWETFRRLEAEGLTMYGQMTAGSWIYIGTQGILQGTFETFAAVARKRFDGSAARARRADRRLRRHGRRAAARRDDARRRLPGRRRRRAPARAPRRDALPRPRRARPRRRAARGRGGARGRATGARSASSARPARCSRALLERGVVPDVVTDQTSAHDPLGGYVPDGLSLDDAAELRERDPAALHRARRAPRWRATARRWSSSRSAARRSSTTATACAPRRARPASTSAFAYPGLRRGLRAAAVLHAAPGRSAGRRSRAIPTTSPPPTPPMRRAVPRERAPAALARAGAHAHRLPGPACAHLLARLRRAAPRGPAVQRARALGRGRARRS